MSNSRVESHNRAELRNRIISGLSLGVVAVEAAERGGIRHGAHLRKRVGVVALLHQLHLTFPVGVAHAQAQQEAVELRRGQELRSGRADGILRRQHEKRLVQLPRLAHNRNRVLLHRFQQCRLRLGRRSVYFVRQYYVAEYWPRLKLKRRIAACVLHYYIRSRYVSRH